MLDWNRLAGMVAGMVGFQGESRISWEGLSCVPVRQNNDGQYAMAGKKLPGFQAATPLAEGLQQTIAWYMNMTGRRHLAAAA